MSNIIRFEKNTPHKVSEVICIKCCCRWISVRNMFTKLNKLECPDCHKQGFVIETGEVIEREDK